MLDTKEYYNQVRNSENVVLAYKGNASDELFNCIIELAESKLDKIEFSSKLKKKVFNILVEVVQNIYHHFDEIDTDDEEYYSVVFLLTRTDDGYQIFSGNNVMKDRIDKLKSRIDAINSMSQDELREHYRAKLDEGQVSDRGGAGLGILDIVRKSGQKLNYEFKNVNQNFSFFSLQVSVIA